MHQILCCHPHLCRGSDSAAENKREHVRSAALKKSADAIKTRPLGEGGGECGGGFATLIIALEYEWYMSAEHLEIAVGWVLFFLFF